ncbi:MAG: NAD(P)/FAD-dependent oxidoreductase [Bacteroidales bacterium]|nr:NAD(P)/FAD-dependent oxidoreductase [Bacteroidales bacterium]
MENKYDVIVIGAGLGGLECAYILQSTGKRVLVLESGLLLGGCLQMFRRGAHSFDTGFHYVGGLDEGQMLNKLFSYFGLLDLPWRKMDQNCFDEVVIENESFPFAQGYDNFVSSLAERFPDNEAELRKYVDLLRQVGDNIVHSFEPRSEVDVYQTSLFARSAYGFLKETISNPKLIDAVSGASLKMELNPDKLPLYVYAQINSTFIQSAYRLAGGGMQIAKLLAQKIEDMGGKVLTNSRVTSLEGEGGAVKAVVVNNGERRFEADAFVASMHPAVVAQLLQDAGLVRKVFAKRMTNLENTFGMLTVNIALKPNTVPYQNKNIYVYTQPDVWNLHTTPDPSHAVKAMMISFPPPTDGGNFATHVDLLTPMNWSDVQPWFGTKVGSRGNDYVALKETVAQHCIDLAKTKIPNLSEAIESKWISTPLTYADYTATSCGSAYGIRKDFNNVMLTVLTPKTPVANLFLTGQSLNLHGILGTSMTSIFTCAELLGMPQVLSELQRGGFNK